LSPALPFAFRDASEHSGADAGTGPAAADAAEVLQLRQAPAIAALLRRLVAESTPLHLSAPGGALLATRLLAHDGTRQRLGFDLADATTPHLQALLAAPLVMAAGYLDGAQLQFELQGLRLAWGSTGCALQAALASRLLRINRRHSRRVRPQGAPTAYLRHPRDPALTLALPILDLGLGGCALLQPHEQPPLPPGDVIRHARLDLDGQTRLELTLELLHVTCMSDCGVGLRLGCRFLGAGAATLDALSGYLKRVQGK
jgi:hypothetical protein